MHTQCSQRRHGTWSDRDSRSSPLHHSPHTRFTSEQPCDDQHTNTAATEACGKSLYLQLQNLTTGRVVWRPNIQHAVNTTWPQESSVQQVWPVRRRHYHHPLQLAAPPPRTYTSRHTQVHTQDIKHESGRELHDSRRVSNPAPHTHNSSTGDTQAVHITPPN